MDWRHHAACADVYVDPELFFATGPKADDQAAKAICRSCPVREQCLEWALDALPDGVAGGCTEDERRALRRTRGTPPAPGSSRPLPVAPTRKDITAAGRAYLQDGVPAAEVQHRLGVSERTVQRWAAQLATRPTNPITVEATGTAQTAFAS
jgi:hypothetical protein